MSKIVPVQIIWGSPEEFVLTDECEFCIHGTHHAEEPVRSDPECRSQLAAATRARKRDPRGEGMAVLREDES